MMELLYVFFYSLENLNFNTVNSRGVKRKDEYSWINYTLNPLIYLINQWTFPYIFGR